MFNRTRINAQLGGIPFEMFDYQSDDYVVKAMIYEPKHVKRIIIYLRGGKGAVGTVRPARLMQFAYKDTLVAAPYYRGTHQNGQDEFAGADREDVYALVKLLRAQYDVPIHFVGFSRGGIQGLVTYQEAGVTSFITWGGVSSIYYMYDERQDLRSMLKRIVGPISNKAAYDRREGINLVMKDSPPIMIVHGTEDKLVSIEYAYMLIDKLKQLGIKHEVLFIEGEQHVMRPDNERYVLQEIEKWMEEVEKEINL
ncbi:prolyl oligopeptidase family serine peptidase [Macrococcus caseolyticus]|uniref:alpha/beta hydrolase family protein n=1 Tax=Macrococcoides caseolyticum TaxID=69966 RepID=UPI0024BC2E29|nr:prolyl oligopeptidase family serine peptidase [Macrococcus caseolyticus]MDJ1152778.1 prolyl oligopeptidase family serine peptidase [Macrococcus caseolyticus]